MGPAKSSIRRAWNLKGDARTPDSIVGRFPSSYEKALLISRKPVAMCYARSFCVQSCPLIGDRIETALLNVDSIVCELHAFNTLVMHANVLFKNFSKENSSSLNRVLKWSWSSAAGHARKLPSSERYSKAMDGNRRTARRSASMSEAHIEGELSSKCFPASTL